MADEKITSDDSKELLEHLLELKTKLEAWSKEGKESPKTFAKQIKLTNDINLINFVTNSQQAIAINQIIFRQVAIRRSYRELIKTPGSYLADYNLQMSKDKEILKLQIEAVTKMYEEVKSSENKEISEGRKKFYQNAVAKVTEFQKLFTTNTDNPNAIESLFDA